MFENLIGQPGVVATLREEIGAGVFPRAALFVGPPWSGKLTAALETARVLTCEAQGAWGCECGSCRLQRELLHPRTVILGWRSLDAEIAASAQALARHRSPPTRYLFLRAVRKLLRRFDSAVWDAEDARLRATQERIGEIEELLAAVGSDRDLPEEPELGKTLERAIELCAGLALTVKNDHVTVAQVRLLGTWARMGLERKVAILENADRMQESARNALLKLLEEPPEAVHLLLTTTRRSAIIPTVLSRLRPYPFRQRREEEEQEVIERIFRADPWAGTPKGLRPFFLAWREPGPERLAAAARKLLERARDPQAALELPEELAPVIARGAPAERAIWFLEELAGELKRLLRDGTVEPGTLEKWAEASRDCRARIDQLNVRAETALLALLARLRRGAA